jgi:flagellar hook-basal body complex protein FliE
MMSVNAINNSLSIPSSALSERSGAAGKNVDSSFGSFVRDAVESVDRSQKTAEQEIARAVAGESPDLHRTIIALQTADLNFQLALQVKNKLVGAYEEIMRMQV